MSKKLLVYIAGPYTARELGPHVKHPLHDAVRVQTQNVEAAIDAGLAVLTHGHCPFIPHLTHYVHLRAPSDFGELYYELDNVVLKRCDVLYKFGDSPGADAEEALAKKLGIPVVYSVGELVALAKSLEGEPFHGPGQVS